MTVNCLNVNVTELDIVNTTTETDLLSFSVPAKTLTTANALRIRVLCDYLNNHATLTSTVTLKIKYGATTMYNDVSIAFPAATATRYPIVIDLYLFAKNSSQSQGLSGNIQIGQTGGATTGLAGNLASDEINAYTPLIGATASEDSDSAKTFAITITHQVADTNISFRRMYSIIESLVSLVTVSSVNTHKYNIRKLTGQATDTLKYNIRKLTGQKTNTFIYKIRQLATNIDTLKYNIRKLATNIDTRKYNIRKLTGVKTNIFIYNIRQLATNSDIHKYNIRKLAANVDTYIYKIRKLATNIDTHKYNIRKLATNQDTHKYNIRKLTGLKTTTYKYNIRVLASKMNTMIYKIRSISGIKVVTYKYNIRKLARNTDTNKYNIRAKSGLSTDTHKYNIRIKTGVKTNTYLYKIRQLARNIDTIKYNIRKSATNIDTNIYNIRAKASKTTIYKYAIRTKASKTNTLRYKIRQLVTSVFTYIYNISPDIRNEDLSIILTNWLRNNWPEDPYTTVDHYLIPPRNKITFGRRFDLTAGSHSDMHIHVRSVHENPMFVNTDATGEDNDDLVNIYVEVRFIPNTPDFTSDSPAPPSRMMWHIRSFIDELIRSNPEQLNSSGVDVISLVQELPDANTTPDVHGQSAIEQMYTIIFTVKAYYHLQVDRLN